jgi:hypothetical protein
MRGVAARLRKVLAAVKACTAWLKYAGGCGCCWLLSTYPSTSVFSCLSLTTGIVETSTK